MRFIKTILFCFVCLFISIADIKAQDIHFKRLSIEDGMSECSIYAEMQDKE